MCVCVCVCVCGWIRVWIYILIYHVHMRLRTCRCGLIRNRVHVSLFTHRTVKLPYCRQHAVRGQDCPLLKSDPSHKLYVYVCMYVCTSKTCTLLAWIQMYATMDMCVCACACDCECIQLSCACVNVSFCIMREVWCVRMCVFVSANMDMHLCA